MSEATKLLKVRVMLYACCEF